MRTNLFFRSFWMGGFDCSSHRRRDGRRLDLLASTGHDRFAARDFARLRRLGLRTVRNGLRWHLIEREPGRYDFRELLPRLRAAREQGIEVIWDLCHYGWPDGLDIWGAEFVTRFAGYARAAAEVIAAHTAGPAWYVPVNEISFWSWIGGDMGHFNPFARGRGLELKTQLVRAALAAGEAVRSVDPGARIVSAEPLIHVTTDSRERAEREDARGHHLAQFQAADMLTGRLRPELGGGEDRLDVVGVNYYPDNQWILEGPKLAPGHPLYRPLRDLLADAWRRHRRPLLITETGAEGEARPEWLRFVAREVRAALAAGVPVVGVCLYPIVNYPGWDDDRHCPAGLWGYADAAGEREVYQPLADELARQQWLLAREQPAMTGVRDTVPDANATILQGV